MNSIDTPQASPQWWSEQADCAREAMVSAPNTRRALIEVAAQHPLLEGGAPGEEFRARLDRGVELADDLVRQGWTVEMYVPGSLHRDGTAVDAVSLSAAGTAYLADRVSAKVTLNGDDLNDRYLPDSGVYGSADECYVSAEYFRDGQFQTLLAVVSPQQLPRKLLHYLAFGVEPLLHTAPVLRPFHGIVYELTVGVPNVLEKDPCAQGPDSAIARRLRVERKPTAA